jgi:hypothetical protein
MFYERLLLMKDLLTPDGSIYLHIEPDVGCFIRTILDEIFGRDCLRTEIAWKRTSAHGNVSRSYGEIWESIYYYTRSSEGFTWNQQHVPFDQSYIDSHFSSTDPDGRRFTTSDLVKKKQKLNLAIELTDFSVYYTQGAMDAAIAAMKDGKSQVLCDAGQLYKVSKSKEGVVSRERLTKHWTDWVDYWAVDFDYGSRKEIIKRPKSLAAQGSLVEPAQGELAEWEEHWTGGFIFENEWQSFRTRRSRELELKTAPHTYAVPGRHQVAVKVIDIFGNDTMTIVPVQVG